MSKQKKIAILIALSFTIFIAVLIVNNHIGNKTVETSEVEKNITNRISCSSLESKNHTPVIDFSGKIPNVDGYRDSKKEKLLTSENKGYSHYCETGEISKLNQEKIKNHFKTQIYKKIVEKSKRLLSV